jgi:hypothetical protein
LKFLSGIHTIVGMAKGIAGELVIIRAFRDRPVVRVVDFVDKSAVYVRGELGLVGFPLDDVFQHDEEIASDLERLYLAGILDWGTLRPWRAARS